MSAAAASAVDGVDTAALGCRVAAALTVNALPHTRSQCDPGSRAAAAAAAETTSCRAASTQ